jgi:beta-lactamase class A
MTADGRRLGQEKALSPEEAAAAVAVVAGRASGRVGLAASHLETGETLSWNAGDRFSTASTIKVAIHASVLRQVRLGAFGLDDEIEVANGDHAGGSGVLALLRPRLRCTIADLCTLMITVSDNTATNMLIRLCGGTKSVNADFAALGFPGFQLNRPISMLPPPLPGSAAPRPPRSPRIPPKGPLGTGTPEDFRALMEGLRAGTVVDRAASAEIINVLRYQQHQALFPRAWLAIAAPFDPPGPYTPGLAHKTGYVDGARTDAGLVFLPDNGGTVAYAAMTDGLTDGTMTALAEGDDILGHLGAIVLARWWPGSGPVPLRAGWLE